MIGSTLELPARQRNVTVAVAYGVADIERAADSLDLVLSDAETEAILANIDDDLPDLASAATRSAIAARIYDTMSRVARGHAWSDDD